MVADRATKRTAGRGQDEDLLPDPAAKGILEIVNLVEHHESERRQLIGLGEEHVAQHLGRHDHDRCAAVDRRVARQEPDATTVP